MCLVITLCVITDVAVEFAKNNPCERLNLLRVICREKFAQSSECLLTAMTVRSLELNSGISSPPLFANGPMRE